METQTGTVFPVGVKGLDVGKLEKDLSAMWAEMTEAKPGGAARGVVRACVLNLIVYTPSAEGRDAVDALLDEVIEHHPCRVFVLVADRESPETKLDAYVATRCQLSSKGAKQICGEQIIIEAAGQVVSNISTAIAPLLIADVPVFLWWKDIPHEDDQLFNRLTRLADRIIIDSAAFDHPHEDLFRVSQLVSDRSRVAAMSDLNWERLTPWRSLVAGFWDVLDYRPELERIERIVIEYERPASMPDEISPKALLAVGWMASRLNWEIDATRIRPEKGVTSFRLVAGGRGIEVVLQPTENTERCCGMLTSLTINCAGGSEFYVGLKPEGTKLETAARIRESERTIGRVLNYDSRSEGQRLNRELEILARDVIYEDAVRAAAQLIATIQK
ncbi:MAG: glucose-6-phosphate dehydrogenase assembly protein OpcA [Pyrinomonadaceae bacterium]